MTLEQLAKATQACLKRHPEWANWEMYNTFEQSWNTDVAIVPRPDNGYGHPTIEIPEEARISDWTEQKWFYDELGIEPSDSLKKDWERDDMGRRVLQFFQERYPSDKVIELCRNVNEEMETGDTLMLINGLWGEVPVLLRYTLKTEPAAKHYNYIVFSPLIRIIEKVVEVYKHELASDAILDAIKCKIRQEIDEIEYGTGKFKDFPVRNISGCVKSVKPVKLPTLETGMSGTVLVVAFEF